MSQQAQQSATSAQTAQTAAEEAASIATEAAEKAEDVMADISAAEQAAAAAAESAQLAADSEDAAEASAAAALQSQNLAQGYANAASNSANAAGKSAENAADSEDAAKTSETNAEASATGAAGSASSAAQSASAAAGSASAASTNADSAAQSASAAEESAKRAEQALQDLGLPTPTPEDAGKVPVVNPAGDGYELGEAQVDAYTKTASDARYAPIEAAIRPTVSGNPATLEHSVAWAMQGLSMYGKSTQQTTTGAQLFDISQATPAGSAYGLTTAIDGEEIKITGIVSNTPADTSRLEFAILNYPENLYGNIFSMDIIDNTGAQYYGIRTSPTTNVMVFYMKKMTIGTEINFVFRLMVNSGPTALPWEPYTGAAPSPSPTYPQPINTAGESGSIAVNVSDGADQSQQLSIQTPNGLPGIPVDSGGNYTDVGGQQWVCDEVDFARGVYVQRIQKILGYSDENVLSPYMSTTGQLTTGATVIYVLAAPIETPLDPEELAAYAALRSYNGTTIVSTEAPVAGLSARYVAEAEDNAATSAEQAASSATAAAGSAATASQQAIAADASAEEASASATTSESWAVGGTGTRSGEDTDNAKYYAQLAQTVAQGAQGYFVTADALRAAHQTGQDGWWAIVGETDTIWIWDSDSGEWVDSSTTIDMSNYYTKSESDERYATAAQGTLASTAVQPNDLAPYAKTADLPTAPSDIGAATAAQGAKADTAVQSVNGKAGTAVTLTPSDISAATAAQGSKADTAVQTVNNKSGTSITLGAADVGAATTSQGAKADTAVQPDDLSPYAKTADLPDNLPNPYSLSIRFNGATQATYNGSSQTTVNITPNGIGAATSAQGAKADAAATAVAYTITVPATGWTSGSLVWGGTTYTRRRTVTAAQATANPTTVLMEYAGGDYASYCTIQLLDTQDGSVVLWAAADPEESCQIKVTEVRAGAST